MPKTKRELDREINEALQKQAAKAGLSRHHLYLLSRRGPGGNLKAGYLTPAGWHGDPLQIEDPKLRLAALREQPAPRFPKDVQRSPIAKRYHSHDTADLRVGQQFDHFGHIYEITKIHRDKDRTVQIARRHRDPFGKETFIDHRSFPARHFNQQHLRPI